MNKLVPFLVACLAALTALAADVPYLSGRVVDNAEILGAEAKRKLAEQLEAETVREDEIPGRVERQQPAG